MDRYEPAFVQGVDEIEFLKYVKDVDDQDVLDSLSLMRRRAGLSVAAPPPPLQIDSDYDDSQSDNDEKDGSVFRCGENGGDGDSNQVTIMACYRVQVQSDNELALTEHNKFEVSRYAYDEILQQDYLEEFDFVSVDEDDQVVITPPCPEQQVGGSGPEYSSDVENSKPSFLSSFFTYFWGNKERIEGRRTSDHRQEQGMYYNAALQNLYSEVDSSSTKSFSSGHSETSEFEGTLNSLSSVFSGME